MFFHTGREFEIYAIGDGLYMQRILNGVAAMSNSGTLTGLVALGLIVGLLVMAVRNVMAGGWKLEIGTLMTSFLLAVFLFGMRADVLVHDMSYVPGQKVQGDFTVANMPFGVAAIGSFVSTIGVTLTERMEQGYSIPGMEDMAMSRGGFGKVLEWVNSIRLWEVPPTSVPGGSRDMALFKSNLDAYIRDCTIPGVEMGHICLDAVRAAPDPLTPHTMQCTGGIGYMTNYRTVEFVTGYGPSGTSGGGKQTVVQTCADGFANLAANAGNGASGFYDVLGSVFPESVGAASAQQVFANAYQSIGVASGDVQGIVVANAVGASLDDGLRTFQNRLSMTAMSELMVEQASQQRLVQWAAEETMFRRIMRPMMAFFESIMYALAPFMALAVGLGTFGFSTIMRYIALSLWVSLWMPVLSIIQLFQITAVQHVVRALYDPMTGSMAMTPTSIAGAHTLRSEALEWMATGAALAAWTPIITMALVYGGSYTASALAGKMQGQDTINEKMTAPDAVNAPPSIQRGSMGEFTQASDAKRAGSSLPTINIGHAVSASESLKAGRALATVQSAAQSFQQTWGHQFSDSQISEMGQVLAHRGSSSDLESGRVFDGRAATAGNSGTTSAETRTESGMEETSRGQVGVSGDAGGVAAMFGLLRNSGAGRVASAGLGMIGFGANRTNTNSDGVSAATTDKAQVADGESRTAGHEIARMRQAQEEMSYLAQWGERNGASWANTLSQAEQDLSSKIATASRTLGHEQTSTASSQLSTGESLGLDEAYKQIATAHAGGGTPNYDATQRAMVQLARMQGGSDVMQQVALPQMRDNHQISSDRAEGMAALAYLFGHYDNTPQARDGNIAPLDQRMASVIGLVEGRALGSASVGAGYAPPSEGRTLASNVADPRTAADQAGQQADTSRVDRASIDRASQQAGPGSPSQGLSPDSISGGGFDAAGAGANGVGGVTEAGGAAARAGVQLEGAQNRADKAAENVAENSREPKQSRHFSHPEETTIYGDDYMSGLPASAQETRWEGMDGNTPVPEAGVWNTLKAGTGWTPPDAGMEQYEANLSQVMSDLPNLPSEVQAGIAFHRTMESDISPGQDLLSHVGSELRDISPENNQLLMDMTDQRMGQAQYVAAAHQARADSLRGQADEMPQWQRERPADDSPVD